jgi:hypothetical protein
MANPNIPAKAGMSVFRPQDIYAIANALVKEVTGQTPAITAVDTSSFVNVGQMCLDQSKEGTLQALSNMIARTIIAVRPYSGRFTSIEASSQEWGLFIRKIAFFSGDFDETKFINTVQNPETLKDGNSVDMYRIKKRYPLEMFYTGESTLNQRYTTFREQLKTAFQSESEFSEFLNGMMVEIGNDVARWKTAENRAVVMNFIGSLYNTGKAGQKVNLTEQFNAARDTQYTTRELLTTHLQEFLSFFVSYLETLTGLMEESSELYHQTPACTDDNGNVLQLLRHTPKSEQKLLLYQPLINDAKAWVYPAIFGPGYLSFGNYEGVQFWQNINNRSAISVIPAQFDVNTAKQVKGKAVKLDYVVGLLYDRRALATNYRQDSVYTTPFNISGEYYNTEHHWKMNYMQDPTENAVLFYMADPVVGP